MRFFDDVRCSRLSTGVVVLRFRVTSIDGIGRGVCRRGSWPLTSHPPLHDWLLTVGQDRKSVVWGEGGAAGRRQPCASGTRRWGGCYFQAEAGIRDGHVTGVQSCALPIYEVLRRCALQQAIHGGRCPSVPGHEYRRYRARRLPTGFLAAYVAPTPP